MLLVLTDFFNFSRNDVTGQCLRGAECESSPQSPPAGAFLQKIIVPLIPKDMFRLVCLVKLVFFAREGVAF